MFFLSNINTKFSRTIGAKDKKRRRRRLMLLAGGLTGLAIGGGLLLAHHKSNGGVKDVKREIDEAVNAVKNIKKPEIKIEIPKVNKDAVESYFVNTKKKYARNAELIRRGNLSILKTHKLNISSNKEQIKKRLQRIFDEYEQQPKQPNLYISSSGKTYHRNEINAMYDAVKNSNEDAMKIQNKYDELFEQYKPVQLEDDFIINAIKSKNTKSLTLQQKQRARKLMKDLSKKTRIKVNQNLWGEHYSNNKQLVNFNKKVKVKSFIRKGKVVKSYDRNIKSAILTTGMLAGAIGGGLLGNKYKQFGSVNGAITGAALGTIPGKFTPKDKKRAKKYRNILIGGLLGAGAIAAGVKLTPKIREKLKQIKRENFIRNNTKLVAYNPVDARINYLINKKSVIRNEMKGFAKSVQDLDHKFTMEHGFEKVFEANKHLLEFNKKLIEYNKKGMSPGKTLYTAVTELPEYVHEYLFDKLRLLEKTEVAAANTRNQLFNYIVDNNELLATENQQAIKNYKAIVKAMSDPNISIAEKKAYQAKLSKYNNNTSSTVNELKKIGFNNYDIHVLSKRNNVNLSFKSKYKLINFTKYV